MTSATERSPLNNYGKSLTPSKPAKRQLPRLYSKLRGSPASNIAAKSNRDDARSILSTQETLGSAQKGCEMSTFENHNVTEPTTTIPPLTSRRPLASQKDSETSAVRTHRAYMSCDSKAHHHGRSSNDMNRYLGYLDRCDYSELSNFRRRLMAKADQAERLSTTKSATKSEVENSDSLVSSKLIRAVEESRLKQAETSIIDRTYESPSNRGKRPLPLSISVNTNLTSKITEINSSGSPSRRIYGAISSSLLDKTAFSPTFAKKIGSLTGGLLENYEEFMVNGHRHRDSCEYVRNYLLNKPDLSDLFLVKKTREFKEAAVIRKNLLNYYMNMHSRSSTLLTRPGFKDLVLNPEGTMSNAGLSPTRLRPRIEEALYSRLCLFSQELKEINLTYRLREIANMGGLLVKKHLDCRKKYQSLMSKLYTHNKNKHKDFQHLIDATKNSYPPYFKPGVAQKITEFEASGTELSMVEQEHREIGKGLDELLLNWTQALNKDNTERS